MILPQFAQAPARHGNGLQRGTLAIARDFIGRKIEIEMAARNPMIERDLDRLEIPRAHDAALRRLVIVLQGSNHDRRADAQPIPGQVQRAVALDERKQMAAAQAGLMVLDRQVQQGLAALFGRLARARLAAFGQILRLGSRLQLQPAIEPLEISLN